MSVSPVADRLVGFQPLATDGAQLAQQVHQTPRVEPPPKIEEAKDPELDPSTPKPWDPPDGQDTSTRAPHWMQGIAQHAGQDHPELRRREQPQRHAGSNVSPDLAAQIMQGRLGAATGGARRSLAEREQLTSEMHLHAAEFEESQRPAFKRSKNRGAVVT
jgi:hypothetical protein